MSPPKVISAVTIVTIVGVAGVMHFVPEWITIINFAISGLHSYA